MKAIKHIGIFDSGIGGLAVANAFLQQRPDIRITYLGDNAFFPYGEKQYEDIAARLEYSCNYLRTRNCDQILIACNTASIVAERAGLAEDDSIWTITRPVIEMLKSLSASSLSIFATSFTVRSHYYQQALAGIMSEENVHTYARPDLVKQVESAPNDKRLHLAKIGHEADISDALLLGCTHFHFLKNAFQKQYGNEMKVLDSADIASEYFLSQILELPFKQSHEVHPPLELIFTQEGSFPPAIQAFLPKFKGVIRSEPELGI